MALVGVMQNRRNPAKLGDVNKLPGRWPSVNGRAWKNGVQQEVWDRQSKPLVIVGTGPSWEHVVAHQLPQVHDLLKVSDVMAINHASYQLDCEVHHIISLHKRLLQEFRGKRAAAGLPGSPATHSRAKFAGVDYYWDVKPINGTSGFLAVMVGIAMGYQKIALVGIPLGVEDGTPRQGYYVNARHLWESCKPHLKRKVRSVYGWTRDTFGDVPEQWAKQEEDDHASEGR